MISTLMASLREQVGTELVCVSEDIKNSEWYYNHDGFWKRDKHSKYVKHKIKAITRVSDNKFIKELAKHCYDETFLDKLDSAPNLIGFTNGVYDIDTHSFRKAVPSDYVSLNVGYAYNETPNEVLQQKVQEFYKAAFPDKDSMNYLLRTIASQLYIDTHNNHKYVHVHKNGYEYFKILSNILGDYIHKFPSSYVKYVKNKEYKPLSQRQLEEIDKWRKKRIIYCDNRQTSYIVSTEKVIGLTQFSPMYKAHIIYDVNPDFDVFNDDLCAHVRVFDMGSDFDFIEAPIMDDDLKMEFMRHLLTFCDKEYDYTMNESIAECNEYSLECIELRARCNSYRFS